jgi:hypothetical protein
MAESKVYELNQSPEDESRFGIVNHISVKMMAFVLQTAVQA